MLLVLIRIWSLSFIRRSSISIIFYIVFFLLYFMWRDLAGILLELSREFNIDKFLSIFVDSLVEHRWDWYFLFARIYVVCGWFNMKLFVVCSFSSDLCQRGLISLIETVLVGHLMHNLVTKVLMRCSKFSEKSDNPSSDPGIYWNLLLMMLILLVFPIF